MKKAVFTLVNIFLVLTVGFASDNAISISADKKIGIGYDTPWSKFTMYSDDNIPYYEEALYIGNNNVSTLGTLLRIHQEKQPQDNAYLLRIDTTSGNKDQFVVKGNGKVGIGLSSPWADLTIFNNNQYTAGEVVFIGNNNSATTQPLLRLHQDSANGNGNATAPYLMRVSVSNDNFNKFVISGNGQVSIGGNVLTIDPQYLLDVDGDIRANNLVSDNGFWTTSDARVKKEINTVNDALTTITKLEGKTYKKKLNKAEHKKVFHKVSYQGRKDVLDRIKGLKLAMEKEGMDIREKRAIKRQIADLRQLKHSSFKTKLSGKKEASDLKKALAESKEDAEVVESTVVENKTVWVKENGLIAQDLKAIPELSHLVSQNSKGKLAVNYNGLIPVLLQSVKEMNEKLEKQEKRIEKQNKRIKELEAKL